jgi:hypothetical protein
MVVPHFRRTVDGVAITEHTAPDDFVFVVPWASGFNFLTDRANPTRIDFMLFEGQPRRFRLRDLIATPSV